MRDALLRVHELSSGYGRTPVIRGVSLDIAAGETVAIIGSNGAGKSTLLKTLVGLVPSSSGSVCYAGIDITAQRPERLVSRGIALVPEGRMLFGPMSVRENLELGAYTRASRRRSTVSGRLERVHELFPVLAERSGQAASTLSGGEQQMLAIGRALMSSPELLLLDEPSLGLAPKVIGEIFAALGRLRREGMTVLLVEQDARLALKHSDRGYVMRTGRVVLEGTCTELLDDESLTLIYLGGDPETAGLEAADREYATD